MRGEFSRRGRSHQPKGNTRKKIEHSPEDVQTITHQDNFSKNVVPKLSFHEDEDQIEFKIKKKRDSNKISLNSNDDEILFKTCIIAKRDKIIDKTDSSFSINIKPIPTIIEQIEKKDDPKVDDPTWNDLETTYVEYNKGKIKVPDALTIFTAKKKRENLRKTQEEIIPIDDTIRYEGRFENGSRLVREGEGFSTSDEEFPSSSKTQITFDSNIKSGSESEESATEDASEQEEIDAWESQQMAKGIRKLATQGAHSFGPNVPSFMQSSSQSPRFEIKYACSFPSLSLKNIIFQVNSKISELQTDLVNQQNCCQDLETRIYATNDDVSVVESQFSMMKECYEFYQYIFGFVTDFISCYDEKLPDIIELENSVYKLYLSESSNFNAQLKDDFSRIDDLINSFIQDDSESFDNFKIISDFIDRFKQCYSEKPFVRMLHITNEIKGRCKILFEDTLPEFFDLDEILNIFSRWKGRFFQSYSDAFISSCLHKLLSPVIRLQLIDWCPLTDTKGIESHSWFRKIVIFSTVDCDSDSTKYDHSLILNIYNDVLCLKISAFIEVWDCYSRDQTLCLRNIIHYIFDQNPQIDQSSVNYNSLFKIVYEKLVRVSHDMFMPFYPARLIENEKSAATIFLINQITFCIEFLKNCLMWMNLIILHKLQLLTIDLVINRFIILGLTQIPDVFISIQFCSKILEIVPHHWFTQVKSNESRSLPTFLGLVERILDNLKENSCNQSSSDILKITDGLDLVRSMITKIS